MADSTDACCPDCGRVGYVSAFTTWRFSCWSCSRYWGHPQLWTLEAAHDAVELAKKVEAEARAGAETEGGRG